MGVVPLFDFGLVDQYSEIQKKSDAFIASCHSTSAMAFPLDHETQSVYICPTHPICLFYRIGPPSSLPWAIPDKHKPVFFTWVAPFHESSLVRETDLIPIMNIYLVFAASAVLMNIHYCWWGTLKQLFGAGLITLYFVVFLPQSGLQYSRHIQKWEYLGGAIGVVLAYFLGSFGIAWIVAKWIFYEAAAVFVALPLLLMWDLHHIA